MWYTVEYSQIWYRAQQTVKECDTEQTIFIKTPGYQVRFISTWPWRWPCDLQDHFMVYIQMVMTAEKATKLGHDQVTCLEACFVVVLLIFCFSTIFQLYFSHKRWQRLYSIWPNWGERNPRLCHWVATNYSLFYSLRRYCMSSSVADKAHVHTRSVVFKIIFQDLIRWTKMFV